MCGQLAVKFHPIYNRRVTDNPVYNRLAFNGYHIYGLEMPLNIKENKNEDTWKAFTDHYPTIESYQNSFSYVENHAVLSPREIYLSRNDPVCGEKVLRIEDNNGKILWSDEIEEAYLREHL